MERRLGRYSEALRLHEQAYAAAADLVGEDHPKVAGMLNQRAQLAQQMGELESARSLYAQAVSIWERLGREQEAVAADPLHNLGLLKVREGAYESGREKLHCAQEIWMRTLPAAHPVFAGSFAALGEAAAAAGETARARELFERSILHAQTSLGPAHVKTGLLLARYAAAMRSLGHKKESRRLRNRAEAILTAHAGWRQAAGTVDIAALSRGLR